MVRKYQGNIPENFSLVGLVFCDDGLPWGVYKNDQEKNGEWQTVKVCCHGMAEKKANYWFVKNMVNGKTGLGRDLGIMRKNRPMLLDRVETALNGLL